MARGLGLFEKGVGVQTGIAGVSALGGEYGGEAGGQYFGVPGQVIGSVIGSLAANLSAEISRAIEEETTLYGNIANANDNWTSPSGLRTV